MALLLLLLACEAGDPARLPERPNLLLIDVDTLRADRLDAEYGGEPVMPTVRALAARGVRFDNALSQGGWTMPALTSLLSGHYPLAISLGGDATTLFPRSARRVAGTLTIFGYATAALWNPGVPTAFAGLGDGFTYQNTRQAHLLEAPDDLGPLRGMLDDATREPFFLLLHDFDAHQPGGSVLASAMHHFDKEDFRCRPEEYHSTYGKLVPSAGPARARSHVMAHYDGAVWVYDRFIQKVLDLLKERGVLEHTIVMVTSNHGEGFADHTQGVGHGPLYDELLRVPLVVAGPGIGPAGTRIAAPVELIDIAPTLLELAGVPADVTMDGVSFAPLLRGLPMAASDRWTYSLTNGGTVSVRTADRKLIQMDWSHHTVSMNAGPLPAERKGPVFEYYDLAADPGELHNRFEEAPEQSLDLMEALLAFRAERALEAAGGAAVAVDDHARQVMRQNGYWGIVGGSDGDQPGAPDVATAGPLRPPATRPGPADAAGAGSPRWVSPPPPRAAPSASEGPLVEHVLDLLGRRLQERSAGLPSAPAGPASATLSAARASARMDSDATRAAIRAFRDVFAELDPR